MAKRARIAILASSMTLVTAGAAAYFLISAPAASASTQVASDIVNLSHGAVTSRAIPLNSSTRGKVAQIGLIPYGADSTHGCAFGLLSTWSTFGSFSFQVENSSADQHTCSADVVAAYVNPFRTWSTGTLRAGQTKGWVWNNANPLSSIYLAGVDVPNVSGCSMQISRSFYRQQPGGEREFVFYVRNNGSAECAGTVLLARVASTKSFDTAFEPGATRGAYDISYRASERPAPSSFHPAVFALSLTGATDEACAGQISRLAWTQRRADGTDTGAGTATMVLVQNVGGITCSVRILAGEVS